MKRTIALTNIEASYTDNTGGLTGCNGTGSIIRTWSLVDNCSNAAATQTQTITVVDNEVPTFTRPADIEIFTDATCSYDASVAITGDVTDEADNCSTGIEATFTDVINGYNPWTGSATITRTWSLQDDCGNAAADQVQIITVTDNIAPTIASCPDNIVVNTDPGECSAVVTYPFPTFNDNCDGNNIIGTQTEGLAPGSAFPVGTTTVSFEYTDLANNGPTICTFTVTVIDNEPPVFVDCDVTDHLYCDNEAVVFATPVATDNCSATVTQTQGLASGSSFPYGLTPITFTASDPAGNSVECSFNVIRFEPIVFTPQNGDGECNSDDNIEYKFSIDGGWPGYDVNQTYNVTATGNAAYIVDLDNSNPTAGQTVTLTIDGINTPIGSNFGFVISDNKGCELLNVSYTTTFVCCIADAGFIQSNDPCPAVGTPDDDYYQEGEALELTIQSYENFEDYSTYLFITDGEGIILDIIDLSEPLPVNFAGDNSNPSPVPSGGTSNISYSIAYDYWGLTAGDSGLDLKLYTYSELDVTPANPQPTIGQSISDIGAISGCFNLSYEHKKFIPAPFDILSAEINSSEGDGGTSPYDYNYHEIIITGGYPPYHYEWFTEGYVRHSIVDQGHITIIYGDGATWAVTITDSKGCGGDGLNFTNNVEVTAPDILDIIDYNIIPETNYGDNGAIDITVQGGTAPYTYEWSGPNDYSADTEDIFGLSTGWYSVTVKDSGNPQQHTVGWYWVPNIEGSGDGGGIRGKVEANEAHLQVMPNPMNDYGIIEFSSPVADEITIAMYALDGRRVAEVFSGFVETGAIIQEEIHTGDLPVGIYILEMRHSDGKQLARIKVNVVD